MSSANEYPAAASSSESGGDSSSDFDGVEVLVEQEATQDLSIPLVRAADTNGTSSTHINGRVLMLTSSGAGDAESEGGCHPQEEGASPLPFLKLIDSLPKRRTALAVTGPIHSGKTTLVNKLLAAGTSSKGSLSTSANIHPQSTARGVSVGTEVHSGFLSGSLHKESVLYTMLDTPGHASLQADAASAVRMADAVLLCLDASEHFSSDAEQAIRQASLLERLPIVLVLTKLDRLILDLHLPPERAYEKMRYLVDSVNNVLITCGVGSDAEVADRRRLVSPLNGTVCFSSSTLGCFFTLDSFARKYGQMHPGTNPIALATRLWGPIEFNAQKRAFGPTPISRNTTFVKFILEPLYKVVAHSVGGRAQATLSESLSSHPKSPASAAQESIRFYVGDFAAEAADALLSVVPSPQRRNDYLSAAYDFADQPDATVAVSSLSTTGASAEEVLTVFRVCQGRLRKGMRLFPVGTRALAPVVLEAVFVKMQQGLIEVEEASAGAVVVVRGVPLEAEPHCMYVTFEEDLNERQVPPIHMEPALLRVSIDAVKPSEATSLRRGLSKLTKVFPGLQCEMEDTGAYTLAGAGELQFETALYDLRNRFCRPMCESVHLSQPYVMFSESVETRAFSSKLGHPGGILAVAAPDSRHSIAMTAGLMADDLVRRLEHQRLPVEGMTLYTMLRRDYGWDAYSGARGIIALGPDTTKGTNVLLDDSIGGEWGSADEGVMDEVVSGFQMATRRGPLCGSEVRGVRFDLVSNLPDVPASLDRATVSQCIRMALLGAHPRLLEPRCGLDIVTPPQFRSLLQDILIDRRGTIVGEVPCPASPLVVLRAQVPMIDSLGLETQIRAATGGKAFPTSRFDGWGVVPGDPFDRTSELANPSSSEPARGVQLARDFVIKTRHRMGLAADPESV